MGTSPSLKCVLFLKTYQRKARLCLFMIVIIYSNYRLYKTLIYFLLILLDVAVTLFLYYLIVASFFFVVVVIWY